MPIQQVVLGLLAAFTLQADAAFTFQNGANGYTGAKDVSINTQYSQYNAAMEFYGAATRNWVAIRQQGPVLTRSGIF